MKLILKILAAPVMLVLTLAFAVLSFLQSLAVGVLSVLAFICVICGLFACTIGGDVPSGMRVLILAFLVSPFGLPAISEWLILKLGDLNYSLRSFITA